MVSRDGQYVSLSLSLTHPYPPSHPHTLIYIHIITSSMRSHSPSFTSSGWSNVEAISPPVHNGVSCRVDVVVSVVSWVMWVGDFVGHTHTTHKSNPTPLKTPHTHLRSSICLCILQIRLDVRIPPPPSYSSSPVTAASRSTPSKSACSIDTRPASVKSCRALGVF